MGIDKETIRCMSDVLTRLAVELGIPEDKHGDPDALFDAIEQLKSPKRESSCQKCEEEMLRVKMCEHIAEGEEGWGQHRNLCPSTMAVAELRDKYEQAGKLLEQWLKWYETKNAPISMGVRLSSKTFTLLSKSTKIEGGKPDAK